MKSIAGTWWIFAAAFSSQLAASPWIDANQLYLRNNIQQLADAGLISAPVTTYPLMWNAISDDLLRINASTITPTLAQSYAQVIHYLRRARSNKYNRQIKLSLANQPQRFSGFGETVSQQAQLQLSSEYLGSFWAVKLSTQLNEQPLDNKNLTFDNSYLAATYGNWVIRVGTISQWWGPGWDSSLLLSNNARPLPALSVSRGTSTAFNSPLLSWIGPWSFTSQVARLESSRYQANTLMWSSRVTARPLSQLEIGLSWSAQHAGDNPANSAQTYTTKNNLAGFDFRWSDTLWQRPISLYAQAANIASGRVFSDNSAYVLGLDSLYNLDSQNLRVFVEYLNSQVSCKENTEKYNCLYEDDKYQTGYRYRGRTVGTTFDNDAKVWTFGVIGQYRSGQQWQAKLRLAQLNRDNNDRAPTSDIIGNQVTKVAEDMLQLSVQYQLPLLRGFATLGADISHSNYRTKASNNDFSIRGSWQYRY